ncbi:MAG: fasciclin domain-containing protein [Pegethrix bostrychoides GSE-TBD4-15B]|jgi:uncharacterized surface protein with fasciclin (FAS1) repeats|uniref:Fasciclin domain-containing protein n=1 Tax=Pegethrix bostrychoides GSE-TBD4-15B TaxID=2839662 RepID=A0A951U557_9CYAN|nr:fasciclin domain-containing protein [Pegethrix bostrychoides GSE-TBD4-15B]
MIIRRTLTGNLLLGLAGLGLATAIGACTPTTDTSTTTGESPVTESPIAESPIAGSPTATAGANATIDQVVSSNGSFSTLNSAIQAAELESTLSGAGPYTVFAPTDAAFAALPPGTLDRLLLPENKAQLQQLLSYHVVPGSVTSAQITPGEVNTVEGAPVNITTSAGEVTVGNARVTEPDITASNGVIHAIDQVLLPPDLQVE